MPQFSWSHSGVEVHWEADPVDSGEFFYRALKVLSHITTVNTAMDLRMFSNYERRWITLFGLDLDSYDFPFVAISDLMRGCDTHYPMMRLHHRGHIGPTNPCAEIPLGNPQEGSLMTFSGTISNTQWRNLIRGLK